MADDVDNAQITEQHALDAAMRRRHAALIPMGRCYSCEAIVGDGRRFCDKDCATDWERIEAARRREGR